MRISPHFSDFAGTPGATFSASGGPLSCQPSQIALCWFSTVTSRRQRGKWGPQVPPGQDLGAAASWGRLPNPGTAGSTSPSHSPAPLRQDRGSGCWGAQASPTGDAQHRALQEGIAPPAKAGLHPPSAAHGALPGPAGSHQRRVLALPCQEHLRNTAAACPSSSGCHSAAAPVTWGDENLSAGVVRKSLFFHVSTWLAPPGKVMFY